ncbi:MAG: response regulator [Candidatus Omnitrophica bacterium]|nr:response regulator [Candidatus Omnitrophota bacterium]
MGEEQRKHILVVEDEAKIAGLMKFSLETAGYDVRTESFGLTALDYAVSHRPDLVILDIRLPDLLGFEVSQRLRKLYDRSVLPILMVTAMDRPIDRLRGFAHGADAYLCKPFQLEELTQTVTTLLERGELPDTQGAPDAIPEEPLI